MDEAGGKDEGGRPSANAWATVGILVLLNILSFTDRLILTLMIGPIKADIGLSDMQIALLVGLAFALLYGLCGLPMGALIDRFSRRWIVFGGILLWSLATGLSGLASNFTELAIARAFVGVGEATLIPAAHSLIADNFGKRRMTSAMACFTIGSVVGSGVASAVGGKLVHHALGIGATTLPIVGLMMPWQLVFLWLGITGLFVAPIIFLVKDPLRGHGGAEGARFRDLFALIGSDKGFFLPYITAQAGMAIICSGFISWGPEYTFRHLGLSPATLAIPYGVAMIAFGILSNLTSGLVIDHFIGRGKAQPYIAYQLAALGLMVPLMVYGLMRGDAFGFYLAVAAFFMGPAAFITYASVALQMRTPTTMRGKMASVFSLGTTLPGHLFGPVWVTMINDGLYAGQALGQAMAILAVTMALIGAVLLLVASGNLRRPRADAAPVTVPS